RERDPGSLQELPSCWMPASRHAVLTPIDVPVIFLPRRPGRADVRNLNGTRGHGKRRRSRPP
ncbi:MAG: hypothetical protein WBE26_10255, partial [Phycisphaerae bacterium]